MAEDTIASVLERFKQQLIIMGVRPERLILFGSCARGHNEAWSDIDLVVISQDFAGKDLRERLELLGVAAARILEPIEAFGVTPEEWAHGEWAFLENAARDGIVYT